MIAETANLFDIGTHNVVVTVVNHKTGNHRTLRVRTMPKDSKFAPGQRVAELLVGPDNTSDFRGFGFVLSDGSVSLWRKNADSPAFRWYARFLEAPGAVAGEGFEVMFEGKCRRCNRDLTCPESVRAGIGSTCAQHEM